MKGKIVQKIYDRELYYTVAINDGWKTLWCWIYPLTYHRNISSAEQDLKRIENKTYNTTWS